MAKPDLSGHVVRAWSGTGSEDDEPPDFEPIDLAARDRGPAVEVSTATPEALALRHLLSWKIREVRNVETLRRVERLLLEE